MRGRKHAIFLSLLCLLLLPDCYEATQKTGDRGIDAVDSHAARESIPGREQGGSPEGPPPDIIELDKGPPGDVGPPRVVGGSFTTIGASGSKSTFVVEGSFELGPRTCDTTNTICVSSGGFSQ